MTSTTAFLINALLQIPVIALVALAAARAMHRAPARQQYRLWLAALLACVVLPFATAVPRGVGSSHLAVGSGENHLPTVNRQLPTILTSPQKTGSIPIAPLLGGAYAAFVLYRLGALALGWRRMRRILGQAEACPHTLWRQASACRVPVLVSDDIATPITLGARRPVIVLPRALLAELTQPALDAVLAHERAHIERGDFLVNAIVEVLAVPIAFHPFMWMVKRRLAEARELACDEQVTPRLVAPRDYARVLIDVAAFVCAAPRPAYSVAMAGGDFEQRIRRIVRKPAKPSRLLIVAAWSAFAASGVAAAAISVHPAREIQAGQPASGTPQERAAWACSAGRARDESAIPTLLAMLGDESPIEPQRCYGGSWTPRLETLAKPSPGEQAALALAAISRPAVGSLVAALDDPAPAVRRNAAWAIGEVRGGWMVDRGEALAPLIRLLGDPDAGVRRAAAFGLSELKSRAAIDPLTKLLRDPDDSVREMAAFALDEIRDWPF